MKKRLLIIGIVIIIAGVLSLLFAGLNLFGYYHVLDGTAELYGALHQRAVVFGVAGIALSVIGAVCVWLRKRK